MIPEITLNIKENFEVNQILEINQYTFPTLIEIKISGPASFKVVSAKLKSCGLKMRGYIAELTKYDGDDVFWFPFGKEFDLSLKDNNEKKYCWNVLISNQIIKIGPNQLELKLELELI